MGDATQGEAVVAGMNLMRYDALALGPRELSLGAEVLRRRMDEARFYVLSANAVISGTDELVALPYMTVQVDSLRVGLIGLTRPSDEVSPEFQVLDPRATLEQYVPLVSEKADVVVVLTNTSYKTGLALARDVPGIDLLVAALPVQLPNQAIRTSMGGAIVVSAEQAFPRHTGRRVGRLSLRVEPDGKLSGESWTSVPLDNSLNDDLEMTALLDRYRP